LKPTNPSSQPKELDHRWSRSHGNTLDSTWVSAGLPVPQHWDTADSNWNRAVADSNVVDPFCCRTDWQLSFHQAFAPQREVYISQSAGSVVAFAQTATAYQRKLYTPLEALWLYGSPMLGAHGVELLEQVIRDLSRHDQSAQGPPLFLVSGFQIGGPVQAELVQRFERRFQLLLCNQEILCSASLAGGLEGYLTRRSASHRRGLKKQSNRARSLGIGFARHRPLDVQQADQLFARMIEVEKKSWKGIRQCGMAEQPSALFYQTMLHRLALAGAARIMFARHAGEDIGFIFGGVFDGIYRGQQFSYVDHWQRHSIGNLLQIEQIRWLCEEHAVRYDMGPMMDYKQHWTEHRDRIAAWYLAPR